jgi:hypothetical protein
VFSPKRRQQEAKAFSFIFSLALEHASDKVAGQKLQDMKIMALASSSSLLYSILAITLAD